MLDEAKRTWQAFSAAENYERLCVPKKFAPWPPVLLDRTGVTSGQRLLDCACGTGVATRAAAARVGTSGRVVGLDLNPEMLRVARSVPSEGAAIEWVEAPVDKLPFADHSFDAVTCELGLMYFPDRVGALREMRRVLVPGGRAGVLVWRSLDHAPSFKILCDVVERQLGVSAEKIRWPYNLGNAETLHQLMDDAGFQSVATYGEVQPMHYATADELFHEYLAGSPISASYAEASEDARTRAVADLREALAPFTRDDKLNLTIGAYIVVGRA